MTGLKATGPDLTVGSRPPASLSASVTHQPLPQSSAPEQAPCRQTLLTSEQAVSQELKTRRTL